MQKKEALAHWRTLAALSGVCSADSNACAMPDYRSHPDFEALRREIAKARAAIAQAEAAGIKAGD